LITLFDTYFVPKVFLAIFLPFLQIGVALWQEKVQVQSWARPRVSQGQPTDIKIIHSYFYILNLGKCLLSFKDANTVMNHILRY